MFFLAIKNKKLALNWKHIVIAAAIFITLFLTFPYQTFNIFPTLVGDQAAETEKADISFSRLFQWSLDPEDYVGSVPASYFSFREMHGSWTLPFLIIGILFLAYRRENKDLFLLAWLVSLYFVLHRDLIGQSGFLHRSLSATAHIFVPLTAVGAIYIASLIKLPKNFNNYLKYGLAAVFVYFALTVNLSSAAQTLSPEVYNPNTQSGFLNTLNDAELEAAEWILTNVPENINISAMGILHTPENLLGQTSKKIRWMAAVSQHVTIFHFLEPDQEEIFKSKEFYLLFDYTMLIPLRGQEPFDTILNDMLILEQEALIDHKLLYNENNIRVYGIE